MGQPLIKPRLPIIRISCRSIDERSQRLRLHQGARLAKSHAQETTATTSGASSRGRAMENRRLLAQRGTPIRLLGDDDRSVRSFNYSGVHSTRAKARFKDVTERVPMLAMALLSTSSGKYRWVSQWAEVSWIIYEWSLNVLRSRNERDDEGDVDRNGGWFRHIRGNIGNLRCSQSSFFFQLRREGNGQFGSGRAGLGSIRNPNLVLCSVSQLEREKGKGKLCCGNNTFLRGVCAR